MSAVARARRGLTIYLGVVFVCSAVIEVLLLRTGDPIEKHGGLVLALMWCPALGAAVARLVLRESWSDVSFRFGGRVGARMLALGWVFPIAVGGLAYGAAWASGLAAFGPPRPEMVDKMSPVARFAVDLVMVTALAPISAISAAGEELGWRGYMLTRLIAAGVPRPIFVSGIIWAAWHLPLILSGQYAAGPVPALSACVFFVDVVAFSYLIAHLRLRSGSIWPAIIAHAAWNSIIQGAFDRWTRGANIWVGESGVLTAIVDVALIVLLLRSRRAATERSG